MNIYIFIYYNYILYIILLYIYYMHVIKAMELLVQCIIYFIPSHDLGRRLVKGSNVSQVARLFYPGYCDLETATLEKLRHGLPAPHPHGPCPVSD